MRQPIAIVCAFVISLLSCAMSLHAQPLADRVPDDAIVYIGWTGAENLGEPYKGSNLKAVVDNSKLRELFTQFFPQVTKKFIEHEPDAEKPLTIAMSFWSAAWNHPTAIFASVDLSNPQQPMPKIGVICKAGKDAPAVHKQLIDLLAEAGEVPIPIESFEKDDMVVLTIGYEDGSKALAGGGGAGPIGQSGAFTNALKQVQSDPALVFYFDVEKLIAQAEQAVQELEQEEPKQIVPKVLDAAGLRGLKRVIRTSGFDGRDWMSMMFVEAPAPRTGLLSVLESKPVSADLLKAIPADATFVATARFDPARLIEELRIAAGKVDPRGPQFIDMGLGAVQIALDKNLVNDILAPMGEDWAMYCSPSTGSNGVLGLVVVNKLDDPAKAQASYPSAMINLSNWVAIALQQQEAEVEIRGRSTKIGELTVYYVGLPIAAPAWTLKDGYLFCGLYPQTAASGARALARAQNEAFAENEKFQALQKRLGVSNPISVSFYDLPAVAGQSSMYGQLLMLARYGGVGDLFGIPLPEPLLPPLDVLQQNLSPAGSVAWIDDAGYHAKSITPFPGAKMLSEPGMLSSGGGPAGAALMVGILLPSLHRARETANRVKCASNMRMIGQGILLYSNDHQGNFPPDLGTLMKTVDITAEAFICPGGNDSLPQDLHTMTPDQIAEWVNESGSYIYLGQGMRNDVGAETIVLYEKPDDHDFDGVNMLFGDGHVEFMNMPMAQQQLARQGVELDLPRRHRR